MKLENSKIKLYFITNFKNYNFEIIKQLSKIICPLRLLKIQNLPQNKQIESLMAFWLLLHHLKTKLKFTHKLNLFKINDKRLL